MEMALATMKSLSQAFVGNGVDVAKSEKIEQAS